MIHKFNMHGTNIVVDVNSGAVHIFDNLSSSILDIYNDSKDIILKKLKNSYKEEEILEAISEIEELIQKGLLFSEDIYHEHLDRWNDNSNIKALCLHISHDCNLRCKYCFASSGNFGGEKLMMPFDIGKKAIDFLIKESGSRKNLEVDFFGGEPLLNFDTVKEIIEYAKSKEKDHNKHFNFTLTTNAVLLNDEIQDYINNNINNVVLSIDGRKEINDNMRFRVDGSGTYDNILPKCIKIAESRNQDNYYVRGTFTRENLDFSKDVLHLADLGFKQISVEPVVGQKESGYDIREEDLTKAFKEYEELAKEYVSRTQNNNAFNFFHFMLDLKQGPCVAKRVKSCGAGYEYVSITPEGDIYPCHQFVGIHNFKIGNVNTGLVNGQITDMFKKSNVYTKDKCKSCFAKFYCSGGCAANAYQFNKNISIPYDIGCELQKKRIECALWIKSQVSE